MTAPNTNLVELRAALLDRLESLAEALLGAPSFKTGRAWRFGRKGSLALELRGQKRGTWFSHEASEGGGPLELIQHANGSTHDAAVAWARSFTGNGTPDPPDPPERRQRPAQADDAGNTVRQAAIADARRMWVQAGPVSGTVAERYLVESRKIPLPEAGWPGMVVRYHASTRSLILVATRDDGTVQAVQRVRLGPDGRKADDGRPVKLSRGPQDGVAVRLPGDRAGPLLLAEGPETGLSVWRATGCETWVALGSMAKLELPTGRRVIVCADDDNRFAAKGKGKGNAAARALQKGMARWKKTGHDITVVYPWAVRRQDGSDFNDALQAGGIDAVQARIEAIARPARATVRRVPVEQARRLLADAVNGFFGKAKAWALVQGAQPPQSNAGIELVERVAAPRLSEAEEAEEWAGIFAAEPPPATPKPPPPAEAIKVDVGAGKSEAARRAIVQMLVDLRAAGDKRNVAIAVPTHALGDEQAERIMALPEAQVAGLVARVWRGRKANDPDAPGKTMCRDLPAVELVEGLSLDPQTTVCRRKLPDGSVAECPHFKTCGYQRQREARADIWVVAHQLVFAEKPAALGKLAAVVMDESFWQAGLIPETQLPLDLLGNIDQVPDDALATERLRYLRRATLDVLGGHDDGPVLRERFSSCALTPENIREARGIEWRRKVAPASMVPGMSLAARKAVAATAARNVQVVRLSGFWTALEALLAGGAEASGWLHLARADDGVRVVQVRGRKPVREGWQVPTLILDAMLQPDLVRPYYPHMQVVADIAVEAPHQRVRQVVDRAFSLSRLKPLDPKGAADNPDEARRRARNLKTLQVQIITEARRVAPGRVLVVMQKAVEEAVKALGPLPPNVETGHHNAIAGRDEWRDVALLIAVGRTMPPPAAVTSYAETLSGSAIPLFDGWYQRADAIRETLTGTELAEADRHPDPLAEAIRWQAAEGELVQIIGRGRGVNRTAANPLDVLVLCDVPLPLPVAETLTAAALEPSLAERMLAEGGVAFDGAGDAAVAYPSMWPTKRAAEQAFYRGRFTTNPNKESLIGECRKPLARVTYQLAGPGKRQMTAWVDLLMVPDPAAWLADRLGSLTSCKMADISPPEPLTVDPVPMDAAAPVPPVVPALVPELLYPRGVLEPPPADMLVLRGPGGRVVAHIEVPAMGAFMGVRAMTSRGLGPWLVLRQPPDGDRVPNPAFLPRLCDPATPRARALGRG